MSVLFFRRSSSRRGRRGQWGLYTQCQMRNYVTKHLWHLTHENSSENVHKTSKLSCMMLQSTRWQFRQVVFSLNMFEIEKCKDIWRPKTWHSLIHIDWPSSLCSLKNHNDLSHLFTWSNLRNKKEILKFLRCKKMLEIYHCAIIDLWFQTIQLRHWKDISYVWFMDK